MNVRDKELYRLIKYAQGLGVKVTLKVIPPNSNNHDAATWSTDGSEIEVFYSEQTSKTIIILNLVHELGHHLWFIYKKKRTPDLKFDEAIEISNRETQAPKKIRKKILQVEREGIKYWDTIVIDTDIKIPRWKIEKTKEFDIWQYELYHETGKFPTYKERKNKKIELNLKHNPKKYLDK